MRGAPGTGVASNLDGGVAPATSESRALVQQRSSTERQTATQLATHFPSVIRRSRKAWRQIPSQSSPRSPHVVACRAGDDDCPSTADARGVTTVTPSAIVTAIIHLIASSCASRPIVPRCRLAGRKNLPERSVTDPLGRRRSSPSGGSGDQTTAMSFWTPVTPGAHQAVFAATHLSSKVGTVPVSFTAPPMALTETLSW